MIKNVLIRGGRCGGVRWRLVVTPALVTDGGVQGSARSKVLSELVPSQLMAPQEGGSGRV